MKIGIITIQKVENYGAELQAFALYRILANQGYKPEIINYLYVKHPKHIEEKGSSPFAKFSLRDRIKWKLIKIIRRLIPYYKSSIYKIRRANFEHFYGNLTYSKTYDKMSSLYMSKMSYDVYITGSDQVWNPATMTNLDPYFLTFVPQNSKKISYASSFGVSIIPDYLKSRYRSGLQNFNFLSSRESDGVLLINEIAGLKAEQVLDPTLLLSKEEWAKVAVPYHSENKALINKSGYILIYTLEDSDYILELAQRIKIATGFSTVKIYTNHFAKRNKNIDLNIFDAGPSEFIDLFLHASFVLTNSFHGTAFAINFEKPFFTIYSTKKKNNSRQIGLLEKMDLSNRLILEYTNYDKLIPNLKCSFITAKEKLKNEKIHSLNFLVTAIENSELNSEN
jgi:hypothetical protein